MRLTVFLTALLFASNLPGDCNAAKSRAHQGEEVQLRTVYFESSDGLTITADLAEVNKKAPTLLLFHQSVSSRGEFKTISPVLNAFGYNTLAVDLRWGKKDFWNDVENETAKRAGNIPIIDNYEDNTKYQLEQVWPQIFKSIEDMKASVFFMREQGFEGPLLVLGSSFSAMLSFNLAQQLKGEIHGVLAYSPGEYHPTNYTLLRNWMKGYDRPVLLVSGESSDEITMVDEVGSYLSGNDKSERHIATGRHGASVLIGSDSNMIRLLKFLGRHFPTSDREVGYAVRDHRSYADTPFTDTGEEGKIPVSAWFPLPNESLRSKVTYAQYFERILGRGNENLTGRLYKLANSFQAQDSAVFVEKLSEYLKSEAKISFQPLRSNGKLPVVVMLGGHPIYHSSLSERIAASGFAVVSIARTDLSGERIPFSVDGNLKFQEGLDHLLQFIKKEPGLDESRIVFIVWSFEGVPVFEYLVKEKPESLLISLDSSLGYEYRNRVKSLSDMSLGETGKPEVYHYTSEDTLYGKDLDFLTNLREKGGRINILKTGGLNHGLFTSFASVTVPGILREEPKEEFGELIRELIFKLKKEELNNE